MKHSLLDIDKMMLSTLVTTTKDFEPFTNTTKSAHSELKEDFEVDVQPIDNRLIIDEFVRSYYDALYLSKNSMIPTFSYVPTGKEKGTYLAIDLGGSTFRSAVVEVSNQRTTTISEMSWLIGDDEKLMDEKFFETIAFRIKTVIMSQELADPKEIIHCGITWSFPLIQTMPNNGYLKDVSKGYILTSFSKDKDLKALIENACALQGLIISIDAIINDAISVVVAGKFLHNSTVGLVLGTGTNSSISVSEKLVCNKKKLKNLDSDYLINTELSFFGYHLQHLANNFDIAMDKRWCLDFKEAPLPHMDSELYGVFQPLEFMTSGRYISELVRLEILEKAESGSLSFSPCVLPSAYGFDTQCICDIYEDSSFSLFTKTYGVIVVEEDIKIISKIIHSVIDRAICALGLAIVALLEVTAQRDSLDRQRVINIGYVGSILQYFHSYRRKLTEFINAQQDFEVQLIYIENSSVNGAAIAAAININK